MSRKKKVTVYHCRKCKQEICLAERILRIESHGVALCTSCSIKFKRCPKCEGLMVKRQIYYHEEKKMYWYCESCSHGSSISVEEGDNEM